jgi:hypothetical protein
MPLEGVEVEVEVVALQVACWSRIRHRRKQQ